LSALIEKSDAGCSRPRRLLRGRLAATSSRSTLFSPTKDNPSTPDWASEELLNGFCDPIYHPYGWRADGRYGGQVDGLKNLISSFETLYNSMPDAQKKIADQVFLHDLPALEQHVASAPRFAELVLAASASDEGRGGAPATDPATMFSEMLRRLETDPLWAREYKEFVRAVSFAETGEAINYTSALAACARLAMAVGDVRRT
jgi:hypothetical protein